MTLVSTFYGNILVATTVNEIVARTYVFGIYHVCVVFALNRYFSISHQYTQCPPRLFILEIYQVCGHRR